MRLADMHIHTTFSPDGKSSMEEQCIKAIEIGIPIICFTDHVDFNSSEINVGRIINKASTNFDVSEYFYEVNRLRRIYNSIQILIGIEFSEPHLFPTEFEDYSSMPFDYILCCCHRPGKAEARRTGPPKQPTRNRSLDCRSGCADL